MLSSRAWALAATLLGSAAPARAIHGGAEVAASEGGAAVFFEWREGPRSGSCSGTLIAPAAVLTAAHCVRAANGRARRVRTVRVGNPAGRTARARVTATHVHPDFDAKRPEAGRDLALLLLAAPVADHVPLRPATAADDPTQQGERLTITGFGLSPRKGRLVHTRKLLGTSLEYLPPHSCFSGPVAEMASTRMCAASPTSGVCPGDSGAPALRVITPGEPAVLIGVVSLAIDERRCSTTAAVLTRVSAFGGWIDGLLR